MSTRTYGRVARADGRSSWVELAAAEHALALSDAPWAGGRPTAELLPLPARRLAPVAPGKILCVGRNYRAHARELGNDVPAEPLLFLKPASALLDPGGTVVLPPSDVSGRIDYEAELAIVIGARARHVTAAAAPEHVFGVTLAFDVTARDLQKRDGQWTRAKGMDTFCPVGPVVVSGLDVGGLTFVCRVNGEVRQRGDARDMIFGVAELIAYASRFFTLEPGDLLLTGTPEGVGPLSAGDALEMEAAGVGLLAVGVAAA